MKSKKVVLYPSMGVGHLVPMMELAKQFIRHGFTVDIPVMTIGPSTELVSKFSSTNPDISFHILPQVSTNPHPLPLINIFNTIKLHNDRLRSFLVEQSEISPVSCIVLDMFCVDALDVAYELGIPAYFFFTCSVASLAVFLHLPTLVASHSIRALKEIGETPLLIPGVPPLPASHLPKEALGDLETEQCKLLMNLFKRLAEGKGLLVNSVESLEPRAVKAVKDGLCLPNQSAPSMYCIGPLIVEGEKKEERHPCLSWLDAQPKESVVFLCFGSMGSFPIEQLKEIATGLENSGQRFLWVVRSPSNPAPEKLFEPNTEPDLDILLPEGFLARTKDRGMVVKHWAPQVEVLKHESVGGFVSHCGWNSTLEAVSFGVPMICWPLYAEQKMNKVFLVEEMKIGIELKGYHEGFVQADELEAKVKWINESDGANELRNRMVEVKESANEAMKEGGSSYVDFVEFLECLK